ncbi:NTP transferase domain-containing protein [Dehalococcoidia bacterium]|nr:NTP transferase domain-containing protein [Dehalococcoidia bacterium]
MRKGIATTIAAGKGTRLSPLTDQLPKCMLDIQGKSIMGRAFETFQNIGITSSVVVGGHHANKLTLPTHTKLVVNDRCDSNNILHSLSYAREEMAIADYVVVSYSDIIFRQSIVEELIEVDKSDITIIVDQNWHKRYEGGTQHPLPQCETAKFDEMQRLQKAGKNLMTPERNPQHWGEFIGMMKLTRRGNKIF